MKDALQDGFPGASALGVALAVRKGLHRQKSRIAYGLHDLLNAPDRGDNYHALEDGRFQPGSGVADMADLRRQQMDFGSIRRPKAGVGEIEPRKVAQRMPAEAVFSV